MCVRVFVRVGCFMSHFAFVIADRSVMNIIRHLDDKQSSAPVAER